MPRKTSKVRVRYVMFLLMVDLFDLNYTRENESIFNDDWVQILCRL